ncbi:MAG: class I SAM-dependent methyltransferase [Elusimicrobia bacterium]|nr:class I SAM-dependent methyltransferase [Elusimicrobiota bacterium]
MSRCPVCGENAGAGGMPGLEECAFCGLAFKADRYFGDPVYEEGLEDGIYGAAKEGLFAEALNLLDREFPVKGRLLDVGCATGELLKAAAARGWRAEGVELNPALAMKAEELGFTVWPLAVEKAMLDKGAYGAATVFEVFCLMDNPAAAAAELFKVMKPGGLLYVREFNAGFHLAAAGLENSSVFKLLGLRPAVLHNFNFRAQTLRVMLERAGFRNIEIRNSRPTAGDPYRTGGRLGGFITRSLKVLYYLLAQALWYASFRRVYAGSTLIVTAKKWPSEGQRP